MQGITDPIFGLKLPCVPVHIELLKNYLGVGKSTVPKWQDMGLPYEKEMEKNANVYDLNAVISWLMVNKKRDIPFITAEDDVYNLLKEDKHYTKY